MKKTFCLFLALLTALTVFAGCSKKDPTADNPPKKPHGTAAATADSAATQDEAPAAANGKVRVSDSELGDIWIDAVQGVALNRRSAEGFTGDGSFLYYNENGVRAAETGIDISSYSGEIDWTRVKNAGVDFVMVRLGGRGYGESGALYADDKAAEYIRGAQAAGIKAGGYFFSQATTAEEAREEALYCKEILGTLTPDCPIAYDWEIIEDDNARTDSVDGETATACARAFCDAVRELGYEPLIYAHSRELYFTYNLAALSDCPVWLCEYNEIPTYYYDFAMWQYSKDGSVDGIEGPVDLNLRFI